MAEGPQPPPERGGGLGEAKSAAHSIPAMRSLRRAPCWRVCKLDNGSRYISSMLARAVVSRCESYPYIVSVWQHQHLPPRVT